MRAKEALIYTAVGGSILGGGVVAHLDYESNVAPIVQEVDKLVGNECPVVLPDGFQYPKWAGHPEVSGTYNQIVQETCSKRLDTIKARLLSEKGVWERKAFDEIFRLASLPLAAVGVYIAHEVMIARKQEEDIPLSVHH